LHQGLDHAPDRGRRQSTVTQVAPGETPASGTLAASTKHTLARALLRLHVSGGPDGSVTITPTEVASLVV
jgi:hypothetical protein